MIKTLIVDDEPLARKRVRSLLEKDKQITISGECCNGLEALTSIAKLAPDLVFLDVQMPELDGFGVLQRLDRNSVPAIIFVTAYDRYAVEAFTARALDFLLKPFNRARFEQALERAKVLVLNREAKTAEHAKLLELATEIARQRDFLERLVVKTNRKHIFIKASDVQWIEAEGDYARLHLGKRSYLIREKMHLLETKLDPRRFVRVHRSTIVNLDYIREVQAGIGGDYIVRLHDETDLIVTRTYKSALLPYLDRAL